jgi:hypothetical protein
MAELEIYAIHEISEHRVRITLMTLDMRKENLQHLIAHINKYLIHIKKNESQQQEDKTFTRIC